MIRTTPLLAVCLAACALPALAQPVAYEIAIGSDAGGGLSKARQDLIQSDQQLQASGAAHLIPTGTTIDFRREALLVVRMGTRPTSGYGIRIRSIKLRPPSASVPGGPAVSLTTHLQVGVVTQSPGPLDPVTKSFTSPYNVVKIDRPKAGGLVASFEVSDAAVDFSTFSRSVGSPFHGAVRTIEVSQDGSVSILEHGPGVSVNVVQVNTVVEDRFVRQLRTALGRADFTRLPTDISGPLPPLDGPHVTYLLSSGSSEVQRVAGDRVSITPDMRARLAPLTEILDRIRDEAVNSPRIREFKGTVSLSGDDVVLSGPLKSYTLTGKLAKTVRMFEGETVKISGAVGAVDESMEVAEILYPAHKPALKGTLQISATGAATLATGNSTPELRGPAAPALATASPFSLVELDGWLFDNLNTGKVERVYVASVQAKVTGRHSLLTGRIRPGDTVSVLGLSSPSGRWARIRKGSLVTYTQLHNLEIGDARAVGPGISGSFGR